MKEKHTYSPCVLMAASISLTKDIKGQNTTARDLNDSSFNQVAMECLF